MRWADWRLPWRFISGFFVVGVCEPSGVFEPLDYEDPPSRQALFEYRDELLATLRARGQARKGTFLWETAHLEHSKGFGSELVDQAAVTSQFGESWSCVPCFCITQSSGKERLIDNGLLGRQNEFSVYSEKLGLCSAAQPGLVARHISECAAEQGIDLHEAGISLESGGEDMPDALRVCPAAPEDYCCNVRAVQDPVSVIFRFQSCRLFSSAIRIAS